MLIKKKKLTKMLLQCILIILIILIKFICFLIVERLFRSTVIQKTTKYSREQHCVIKSVTHTERFNFPVNQRTRHMHAVNSTKGSQVKECVKMITVTVVSQSYFFTVTLGNIL